MRLHRHHSCAALEPLESRRLLAFGKTDVTFGDAGRVVTPFAGNLLPAAVQQLCVSGGLIIAGGDAGLVRYTSSGAIDSTFGSAARIPFTTSSFHSHAVDSSGNVFALLSAADGTVVVKYDSQGRIDKSFGDQGTAVVTSSAQFFPNSLAVDKNGNILVAGTRRTGSGSAGIVRIYRLDSQGAPDASFATGGVAEFPFGQALDVGDVIDHVAGISALSSGQILVGGGSIVTGASAAPRIPYPQPGPPEAIYTGAIFAAARLNSDGQLDPSYGQDGIARAVYQTPGALKNAIDDLGGPSALLPSAFAAKPDGTALLAADDGALAVASFDSTGTARFNVHAESGFELDAPSDAVYLPDGRAALVGQSRTDTRHGLVTTQVRPDGSIGNAVFTDDLIGSTTDLQAQSPGTLAVASDGRLLVGGAADNLGGYEVVKFSAGKISDPRPDDFGGATVNDIAKDSAGGLHVAFYDSVSTTLKYAYRAPNGLWNGAVTVDATPNAGGYLSLAVTSQRQPVIAYFDGLTADLNLAASATNGKTWTIQTIDSKGSVGQYPSLAIDGADRPRVSYYRKTSGDLRYAALTGSGWRVQTIDGENDVGRSSTLVINARTGRSTVAYADRTARQIKYAAQNKSGGWEVSTAAKYKGGADYLSMGYSYYFGPIISYYDTRTTDLKLAYYQGDDGWQGKVVGDDSAQGLYTAIAFPDYYDDPSVYAYDRAADKVVLFDDSTDEGQATTVITGGGRFLSVVYDGTYTDIAYFDTASGMLKVRAAPPPGDS